MPDEYDESYRTTPELFGASEETVLHQYADYLPPGERVLDIGAGQGRNALFLAACGFPVTALDPSSEGLRCLERTASEKGVAVDTFEGGFDDPSFRWGTLGGVCLFGILQILPWSELEELRVHIERAVVQRGLVFATAFLVGDAGEELRKKSWRALGRNSYTDGSSVRTYLDPGELRRMFASWEPLHYVEGLGAPHRHGNGPIEQHSRVEAVFRR